MTELSSYRAVNGETEDSMDLAQGFHLPENVKEPLLCAWLSEILREENEESHYLAPI